MAKLPLRPVITEVRQQRHYVGIELALIAKSWAEHRVDQRLQHLLYEDDKGPNDLAVRRWGLRANIGRIDLTESAQELDTFGGRGKSVASYGERQLCDVRLIRLTELSRSTERLDLLEESTRKLCVGRAADRDPRGIESICW